jgi:hypothetical protein
VENSTIRPDTLELRIAIDAELRRLDWHWKHPRIQAWLKRVSEATNRPVTMVCDLSLHEMTVLLSRLQAQPKQLEIGGEDAS